MKSGIAALMLLGIAAVVIGQATRPADTKPSTTTQATQTTQEGKIVNVRCPILEGSTVDPNKTPESLTRMFKGQKVGFCCAGCVAAWDKLTDAERQAKLDAAMKPAAPAGDYGGKEPSHGAPHNHQ
jgi:hypothetical protein